MNEKSRQMDELLRAAGLAPKETHCYGSQVVVTVRSREMAQKVASFLKASMRPQQFSCGNRPLVSLRRSRPLAWTRERWPRTAKRRAALA